MTGLPTSVSAGPSRRALLRALPLLALAGTVLQPAYAGIPQQRDSRLLLGTRVDMLTEGASPVMLAEAMASAYQEMARLSAMMSRYEPTSALSQVNRAAGLQAVTVPAELMAVLQTGVALHQRTEGRFDMTVGALKSWHFEPGAVTGVPSPALLAREQGLVDASGLHLDPVAGTARLARPGMALDLGGVAKLPILDAGMRRLQEFGVKNALINGGGDVLYLGRTQGRAWRVGLRDPRAPSRILGALDLQGRGVLAASGDYERCFFQNGQRQHHILDPRTGRPSHGASGVSLWAPDVASVNGLGSAVMISDGAFGRDCVARTPQLQALVVQRDHTVWASAGMQQALRF